MLIVFCILGLAVIEHGFNLCVTGNPTANTNYGQVTGKEETFQSTQIYKFLGIPYAKPPLGDLRFMKPVNPDKWSAPLDATNFKPSCKQGTLFGQAPGKVYKLTITDTSEDCLYLNIIIKKETLDSGAKKPVMFWIHGGAYQLGNGIDQANEGVAMVSMEDVVLVTINYRLGAFGFLYADGVTPNLGLWDQNAALKWVRENIANFGGDPNAITIFGNSAGGMSVSAHILSPISSGMFKNAIIQSGVFLELDPAKVKAKGDAILEKIGCKADTLKCLKTNAPKLNDNPASWLGLWPVYGDEFIPKTQADAHAAGHVSVVNLLAGVEKDDGSIFYELLFPQLLKPTYAQAVELLKVLISAATPAQLDEMYFNGIDKNNPDAVGAIMLKAEGDRGLICPTLMYAQKYSEYLAGNGKVYAYFASAKPKTGPVFMCNNQPRLGTCHMDEIPFVFGHSLANSAGFSENEIKLSKQMMHTWTEFAKTGVAPAQGGKAWPDLKSGLSAVNFNYDDPGKIETERLNFCSKYWSIFAESIHKLNF